MATTSKIERLPGARAVCTVTFPKEQVEPAENAALQRLASEVKLPGFRPGKAPPEVLREHIKEDLLFEETVRALLPETFSSLVKEHALKPIIHPKVEAVTRDPLTLKITFNEHPEVKLKGVEKIRIEKKEPKVDSKDVDRVIQSVQQRHRETAEVQREARTGDEVEIDFSGSGLDGKEIPGTKSSGYRVTLGSQSLIPGFEDALIGLKKGDAKTFLLTFPEKYQVEHLRGKPASFAVSVKNVREVKLPPFDDAFAKKHFGMESTALLRERIEAEMRGEEERFENQRREQALLDAIREATIVEIAPELVDEEERALLQELDEELTAQGLTAEDWMKRSKKNPVELREEMRNRAERRLKLRLGLQKLVEEKGRTPTDQEMEIAVKDFLAGLPPEERGKVEPELKKGSDLYERLRWQWQVKKVVESMLAH